MASYSPGKRRKLDASVGNQIAAQVFVDIPWADILPLEAVEYLKCAAASVGSLPEYVLFTMLGAITTVLGSSTEIHMGEDTDWRISPSLYLVAAGPPGTSKTSAMKAFLEAPLRSVSETEGAELLINEYTKSGLHQHLNDHNGEGCIFSDEMHMTLKTALTRDKDGSGERAVLNKLWSNSSWSSQFSAARRRTVEMSNLVICGLTQYDSWLEIHTELASAGDGLLDRIIQLIVKPHWCVSKERESAKRRLREEFNMICLGELLQRLYKTHHVEDNPVRYTITDSGMAYLNSMNDAMVEELNVKVSEGNFDFFGVQSKFTDNVAKLSLSLHNLSDYVSGCIKGCSTEGTYSLTEIDIKRAAALLGLCRQQSTKICEIVNGQVEDIQVGQSLSTIVMKSPGPFCLVRDTMRKVGKRKAPSTEYVLEELGALEEQGLGQIVTVRNSKVFVKTAPIDSTDTERYEELKEKLSAFGVSPQSYKAAYARRNHALSETMHKVLMERVDEDLRQHYHHSK